MGPQSLHKISELLETLERVTGEPGKLTSTLQRIAETARNFFSADSCVIFAINPITGHFVESLIVYANNQVENGPIIQQPQPGGITTQVLQQKILVVKNLAEQPAYHSPFTQARNIQAFVGTGLYTKYGSRPLGVIYLNFKKTRHFSNEMRELLQIYADQASHILQATWLVRRYREVARIGKEINEGLTEPAIHFQQMEQHVAGILDISHTFLLVIYISPTNTLDVYLRDEGRSLTQNGLLPEGIAQHVIETKETFFSKCISRDKEHLSFRYDANPVIERGESVIFVPLVLRGVTLGFLSIQHPKPDVYTEEDRFILELLGNHIALALYNYRLYDSLIRLNDSGQFLTQQIDSAHVLQETVDKILQAIEANSVILYAYDSTRQSFILPPSLAGTLVDLRLLHSTFLRAHDIAVLALKHGEPIFARQGNSIYTILPDAIQGGEPNFQKRENIQSVAVMPLFVGETPVGVLFLNFCNIQRFDTPQKTLVEGLAHYAAIAIKNAQTFGTISKRRIREFEISHTIDREVSRVLDLNQVLDIILNLGQEHVLADEASILLVDQQGKQLLTAAAIGRHAEASKEQTISLRETKAITRWVVENEKAARVKNVKVDLPWRNIHLPVADDTLSELDVPIFDGEKVIGVLNFESKQEAAFDEEAEKFLRTLADKAVLAITNAKAYEREKRLAADFEALNHISQEITSQLEPDTHIFDLILETALDLTHCDQGNLMLYDPNRNDLWMAASRNIAEDKSDRRQRLDEGVVGYVATHKKVMNVDLTQEPWNEINMGFFPGTLAELAVPMLAKDKLLGILNIESTTPNHFSEVDERLITGLAGLAVIALQNAESYAREKQLVEESQVLNTISREITSQLNLNHVFDLILDNALKLTRSNICTLVLYQPDRQELWVEAERGVETDRKNLHQRLDKGVVGYVARTRRATVVQDVLQSPWHEIYLEISPDTRSELAVPMVAGDTLHGVLNVESSLLDNFREKDKRLLQGLADLAVIALQNARAFEREKLAAIESQALNEISKTIAQEIDFVTIFQFILRKALELTGSTVGSLHLYDAEAGDLRMAAEDGVVEEKKGQRQQLGVGIVGQAALYKELQNVEDVTQAPWNKIFCEFSPGIRSELAVPMLEGLELRGVLNVENLEPGHFKEPAVRLLTALADLAVVAFQNTERYKKANREALHTEKLYKAGRELANLNDWTQLEQVYDIILRIAEEHSLCQVVIRLYDDVTQELPLIRSSNYQITPPFPRMAIHEGLNGQVVREMRTIAIPDTRHPPAGVALRLSDTTTRSLLVIPVRLKNRYYGNLSLGHREPGYFDGSEASFFEGLADQMASTIHRLETIKTRQELEKISSFGQSAFHLTHLLGNALGLYQFYIEDIQSQMAKSGMKNEVIDDDLAKIARSARRVLDFSTRLKKELEKQKEDTFSLVSPRELLKEAVETLSTPPLFQSIIQVGSEIGAVRVVRNQIIDILQNLIMNAIDAMSEGGTIILRARNSGRFVALEVIDTGIGIPVDHQKRIFELSYSLKEGGSGFGLWSALLNAQKNDGELRVKSRPGHTVFSLLLPRTDEGIV